MDPVPPPAAAPDTAPAYRTRSGRAVKPPERFQPEESDLVDDFMDDEYDTEFSDPDSGEDISETDTEDSEETDTDDTSLDGFIVKDGEEMADDPEYVNSDPSGSTSDEDDDDDEFDDDEEPDV